MNGLNVNWNTSMYDHPPVRRSKRPRAYETRSILVLMRDGPGNLYVGYYDWFTKLWYTADGLNIVYVNGWRELSAEDWAAIQKISPGWKCDGIPDVPGTGKNKKRVFSGLWEWAARRNNGKRG